LLGDDLPGTFPTARKDAEKMSKSKLLQATALNSMVAIFAAAAFTAPAYAQETQADAAQNPPEALQSEQEIESGANALCDSADANCGSIVVTGSRIRRPNLVSAIPVTSIGGEEFFETGNVSVGDTLNDLPALRSTFSQANSTRFLGTAGLNLLDLRGLGTVRTLVLQNGRRHVGGDVLSSGVTPDVNTIPTDLIERVDIVTGGNSAVYGSDAIAGVVNFILKDDYQGLQLRGQSGISKYGDAGNYFVSGLAGTNFANGRGNVAINVEYARQDQYFGAGRPFIESQDAFLIVDSDPAGALNGSDGTPDRLFFRDIRSASLTNTGIVRFGGTAPANSCGTDPLGSLYPCVFIFNVDGTLIPATGTRVAVTPGSFVGGNSENFRGGRQFQLEPQLDRYNINVLGHFDVAPGFTPFFEAKYSRTDSSGTGSSGPAFIQGGTLGDPLQFFLPRNREQFRLDNPFLNPQARALIVAQRTLNGQASTNATQISLRQNMLGLGARTEEAKRETYRIVGGVRGDFWDDWNYEVSVNYGKLTEKTKILGNLDIQRFLLGMDAAVNPATGQIQCRSQFDPSVAIGYYPSPDVDGTDPNGAARLAADIAACVPINPFGGQYSQAVRDYTLLDTVATGKTSQVDVVGFVSGDTSSFFNLWGGPLSFVLGAEYRQDNLFYHQAEDVTLGYTFYNAIPTFSARKSTVKEAFAEVRIPIIKDVPFFHELEITGAARVSDYSLGTTGTVWAYNASAIWAPIRDIRFRGNYGRSVRAPNQSELFAPLGQNFAPGLTDPCSSLFIGEGSANRAANCAAAGRPGGTDATINPSRPGVPPPNPAGPYDFRYDSSLEIRSGGNPLLSAETSDSYTLGTIIQPRFMPGFSLSVDYYDITVNKVITGVAAQTIVDQCYDSAAGNPFCALFQRAGAGGGPGGEQEFRIIEGSLIQGPVNFAKLKARGVDVEAAYRAQLFNIGRLDTRLTYTHVLQTSTFLNPVDPTRENVVREELGDPKDAFNWNTSLKHGRLTVGYQMRYIGAMYVNTFEDFNSVQGRDPENADFADRQKYPSVFYHDVRAGLDATDKFNFYLGVDNLTNKAPPLGLTGIGAGSGIYTNRGRSYYAGVVAKF
jgi:outer membrane receptor protein involved in Fe transport